ncbi:IQ motif and ankyrin repeat domain-containing protein 1 [Sphaerodactylus townsendi]|uniref:IQ motif and ankyrin repeat domain-containing protein 1 n=1 Tax=Sphaerodactylus townsendi TaxID=933632 RepID=UPI00202737D8|nr:IQ motif and ankyrin repeat domain-containing protein 1 [Sphaerodactylus townsendi]
MSPKKAAAARKRAPLAAAPGKPGPQGGGQQAAQTGSQAPPSSGGPEDPRRRDSPRSAGEQLQQQEGRGALGDTGAGALGGWPVMAVQCGERSGAKRARTQDQPWLVFVRETTGEFPSRCAEEGTVLESCVLSGAPHPTCIAEQNSDQKAALTLQCAFRCLLARRERAKRLKEQHEYRELMDRLEREAFVALVKREQEEAERERKKEEEEKKKLREEQQRKKRMLEAAFDGDVEEMKAVLQEVANLNTKSGVGANEKEKTRWLQNLINMVECTDANGNTPLSEASGGGHPLAIQMLIENGANPNSRGAFNRTPLYRAAFGGHVAAVEVLLQHGADPRLYADDGNTPEQVASLDSLVAILNSWDLSLTDSMLQKMEAEQQRRTDLEKKQKEAETHQMAGEVEQLAKEHERCNKKLQQAYCELNRRITEHDKCQRKQMGNAEITLHAIADAEGLVQKLQGEIESAAEKLSLARLKLREQLQGGAGAEFQGLKCSVQELDDVLFKDVGGKIHSDGRWPLVIDPSGQAAIFLRYRDTNYLNAVNPSDMSVDTVRLALLGAIRYGKPLVFDMMEVNMFDTVKKQLDRLEPGLAEAVLDGTVLQNERYLSLLRPTDGPEYADTEFQATRTEKFRLFVVTKQRHPPEELLRILLPIQVVLPRSSR